MEHANYRILNSDEGLGLVFVYTYSTTLSVATDLDGR